MSILLLGCGYVAKPCLDFLLQCNESYKITIGCRTLARAEKLAGALSRAKAISIDVNDEKHLNNIIAAADIVISLLPYSYHVQIIRAAIRNRTHVVTTSYISPAMQELDNEAKSAGIIVMNEIGLDPGIDHLYAIKTIDEVHALGGKIKSFISFCGGLPSPESSNNPLGYKFSWSPRGFLLALKNNAKFYQDGKIQEIAGMDLMDSAKPYFVYPGFALVGYANRDSTQYKHRYNISEAQNIVRGTLRYQGFPQFISILTELGFLNDSPQKIFDSSVAWKDVLAYLLKSTSSDEYSLINSITLRCSFGSEDEKKRVIFGLRWLGLFSEKLITPRGNALDTLCALLEEKMQYNQGEKDVVVLQHIFDIVYDNGEEEQRTSTLVECGDPNGYSAMARLVGIPCAIATQLILKNIISKPGIHAPIIESIAAPLRKALEEYGIGMKEETTPKILLKRNASFS